jgi:hypothetical protein
LDENRCSKEMRRKLHNEEIYSLHSSLDIARMMKYKRMRWVGRAAYMGQKSMQSVFRKTGRKETT